MNEFYRYVFIRTDIPFRHQVVQSNHASYHVASLRGPDTGIPNLVTIGMPNLASIERVLRKLKSNQIPHYAWYEPDNDWGLTAIATAPLEADSEQRKVLANYRVYAPEVSANTVGSNPTDARSTLAGCANAGVVV
jgi:hypothetical protein